MIFRWWMAPAIGVGLVAVANGVLIATALRVRPQKSEASPYAASAFEDTRASARDAFAERGWRMQQSVDGSGVTLLLEATPGPRPRVAQVKLFRPDDASADREIGWTDPLQPLRIDLPRPGAWALQVGILDDTDAAVSCEVRVIRP